jgi:hypothetical protein
MFEAQNSNAEHTRAVLSEIRRLTSSWESTSGLKTRFSNNGSRTYDVSARGEALMAIR